MGQVERRKRVVRVQAVWHLADVLAVVGGFALGHVIRFSSPFAMLLPPRPDVPPFSLYVRAGLVASALWVVLFHALDLYQPEGTRRALRTPVLLRASLLGMLLDAGVAFFYREASFSRVAAPIIWLTTLLLLVLLRRGFVRLLVVAGAVAPIRFAVAGTAAWGQRVIDGLPRAGVVPHRFEGVFRDADDPAPSPGTAELGGFAALEEQTARHGLDRIVIALPATDAERLERVAAFCVVQDLDYEIVPEVGHPFHGGMVVEEVAGVPVLRARRLPLAGWGGVAKRAMDVIVSAILLALLAPILIACAIAVRLDSPGPVFYRQERMGRDRKTFHMLKFRSMRSDAESSTGPKWADKDDPRRTRVGVFLRTWSLDELPQLLNVLSGEMSLVGPRPERPHFVEQFEGSVNDYFGRHRIKSGITGWAQVNGLRGNAPIEERTRYDLYYMENWSIGLDLRILMMTAVAVFTQRGS